MPEPFKNLFNPTMIAQMAGHLAKVGAGFDQEQFVELATHGLDRLELKQRSTQIQSALTRTLPQDFRIACEMMTQALHPIDNAHLGDMAMDERGIRGWAIMPIADYVAEHGLDDFEFSMDILAHLTKRFSAEFAVRHFFLHDPQRALEIAIRWTKDENHHVRRLASEGSRPRLPWGIQLKGFVDNPAPLLPLLENLKDDKEEYVRRSVANNLNDIAKDHPDIVAGVAKQWLTDASKDQERMVKHACRSLVKSGHKPTLAALGYRKPKLTLDRIEISTPSVKLEAALVFSIKLTSTAKTPQPLIIDFNIHHKMANGDLSPKTFKWKILELNSGETLQLTKKHPIKPITTRKYYPGTHLLEIQINGESFGDAEFELRL